MPLPSREAVRRIGARHLDGRMAVARETPEDFERKTPPGEEQENG